MTRLPRGRKREETGPYPNRLRALLDATRPRMDQKQLAERTGIPEHWISYIANGHVLSGPRELDLIVEALGVSPERIYDEPFLRAIDEARRGLREAGTADPIEKEAAPATVA